MAGIKVPRGVPLESVAWEEGVEEGETEEIDVDIDDDLKADVDDDGKKDDVVESMASGPPVGGGLSGFGRI
jgi:hypothetical protein